MRWSEAFPFPPLRLARRRMPRRGWYFGRIMVVFATGSLVSKYWNGFKKLKCKTHRSASLADEHTAVGQIFITANIRQAAEFIHPAMSVQINCTRHPIPVNPRIDAERTSAQAIIASRPINKLRIGGYIIGVVRSHGHRRRRTAVCE